MGFDISRLTFNPLKDYFGVVMEQGRVQLDSDWNEFLAEVGRRIQAGTMDIVGLAGVPSSTPYAFRINASVDTTQTPNVPHVTISAGRIYVDGLLAENHGLGASVALAWDPALAELSAAPQTPGVTEVIIDYTQQPYLPGASLTAVPVLGKQILLYLDVWQREVTYLEDLALIEKAVGIDTTGRLQTIWQVKWCDVTGLPVYGSTPDSLIAPFASVIVPSPSRLTTGSGGMSSAPSGPCALSPTTGYTGMENQLYRVEIHQSGSASPGPAVTPAAATTATFKWSRDNASVATAVTAISATAVSNSVGNPASQLTVQSLGRDQTLGFQPAGWIEITADYLELNGVAGELHQIDSINAGAQTILLDSVVSANLIAASQSALGQNVRIQRWDQAGTVYLNDGATVWVNLNASGSAGIPVPPSGTKLILENGITVAFDLDPSGTAFQSGDFWLMAARTADASVDLLTVSPPFGIHHHYCRLGVVDFSASPPKVTDCRPVFLVLANRDIHVTGISYGGTALVKNSTVAIQALQAGINVQFDVPLDPAIVPLDPEMTTPASAGTGNCPVIYVVVDFPGASASGGLFTPTIIPATVSVGAPPNDSITWMPTSAALSALSSLPIGGPPLLARLILKGDSIWAVDSKKVRLNGASDGRGRCDFETWFWLIPQPTVTLTGTSVNFSNPQLVGAGAGAAQTVTLTNNGASALTITLATSGDFAVSGCTPTVAAKTSCTLTVTFNPTAAGTRTGTATVSYTTGTTAPVISGSIPISLVGTAIAPGVTFTPTVLPAFPLQTVGTVSPAQMVVVASTGSSQLTVSSITLTGANAADFAVQPASLTLQAGASENIPVSFKPTAAGSRTANLVIVHNAPGSPETIALSGTGQAAVPAVTASPTSLAFHAAGTLNVTLTSTGNAALTITSIAIAGGNFRQTSTCGAVLAPNAQCTISVTCVPPASGNALGSLIITHNAAGSPLTISLGYSPLKIKDKVTVLDKIAERKVITETLRPSVVLSTPVETPVEEKTKAPAKSAFITPEERPAVGPAPSEASDEEPK
jgi:hypothetical protein